MQDLFERELKILEHAKETSLNRKKKESEVRKELACLVLEYERILRQLKLVMRHSDRTTIDLNSDKLNLLDKINIDVLTGIYNRRYMETNLKRCLKSLSRFGGPIVVMMIDIDFFKKFNDTYGHSKGDTCLRMVATALEYSISRADDFVARYGGEEFIVVLPNTSHEGAIVIANKILRNVRKLNIPHETSEVASYVTVSVGITSSVPSYKQEPDQYIERADAALYASKSNGRDQYTYFNFMKEEIK